MAEQLIFLSIVPESSAIIEWLHSVGERQCALPKGACLCGGDSDAFTVLSELQGYYTFARRKPWLLYYPLANAEELRRVIDDVSQSRYRSPSAWQLLLERIATNCRSAMMPWMIDISFSAHMFLSTDAAHLAAIKDAVAAAAKIDFTLTIDHSWISGESIGWIGIIAHEYDRVGNAVWDTCISEGKPPLVVTTGFRRELPLLSAAGNSQPTVWIERAEMCLGNYEIYLRDPEDYWIYRPTSRNEFHDMCRSSSAGHATLTLVFPDETSIDAVKSALRSISAARAGLKENLECYLTRWQVPEWVYYVGGSHPDAYTLFLSKDEVLTRSILECHEESGEPTLSI